MYSVKNKVGFGVLLGLTLAAMLAVFLLAPISQDISYHSFKDGRELLAVANFWNVISNLPFLLVGLLGLKKLSSNDLLNINPELKLAYIFLFGGVALVAFGSSYYHLEPNNQTLLWDRLPMTIAFMALFSIVIAEFVSLKVGKLLLLPLILVGISSVLYWYWGELNGVGDLRFYALVQFLPILCIPVILLFFSSTNVKACGYWWLLLAYVVAKFLEYFDSEVFEFLGFISGHSLKHIMAAMGVYFLLISLDRKNP